MRGYESLEVGAQRPRVGGNLAPWKWRVVRRGAVNCKG